MLVKENPNFALQSNNQKNRLTGNGPPEPGGKDWDVLNGIGNHWMVAEWTGVKSVPGKSVKSDHKMFTDLDYNSDVLLSESFGLYSEKENTNLAPCLPQIHTQCLVFNTLHFFICKNWGNLKSKSDAKILESSPIFKTFFEKNLAALT